MHTWKLEDSYMAVNTDIDFMIVVSNFLGCGNFKQ